MRCAVLLLALVVAAAGKDLQVTPAEVVLTGKWATQRLIVEAPQAHFRSANPKIAAVTQNGIVTPVRDGETTVTVSAAGRSRKVQVSVRHSSDRPASFRNYVEPALAALGCNSSQCHGAAHGQGGLALSLFGGDPRSDFDALTRAAGGRRVNRIEPRESLVWLKATGALPHPGTAPAPNSPALDMLLAWLERGAPWTANEPAIVGLQIYPEARALAKGAVQPLAVTAVFDDGTRQDVTGAASLHTSDPRIARISAATARAVDYGDAAIAATYLGKSAVFRIAVPQPAPVHFPTLEANNRIDELVYAKLKAMGIPPSEVASDEAFLRRVSLDTTGLLPTPDASRAFLTSTDPSKRATLIDRLLDSPEFADFQSLKWGDLLRIKSEYPVRIWPKAVAAYYQWVHDSIAHNKPYDQFARELLTATGSNFRVGPANFVRAVQNKDARSLGETAALVFMGARIGCARCHAHTVESWTLDDDLSIGAFFARVNYKSTGEWKEEIVYPDYKLTLRDPRTRQPVAPRLPGAALVQPGPEEDPRVQFAAWLTAPENPWFARNIVNRIWFWLLGRGIIHEPDDLRPTNPPTNPELLAFLEHELLTHHYDLKHIYRLILNSRTYQLSSDTNQWNAHDIAHFSHYSVRRLTAEQMLDAVSQFTETNEKFRSIIPEPFSNWPADYRATQISDGNTECSFLDLFGRPPRDTPYEGERNIDLTLRQTLYFLNSEQLEGKLTSSPRLKRLSASDDVTVLEDIYLSTLSRFPTSEERRRILDYLAAHKSARAQAIQDIAWAILNSKEFEFNH